MALMVNAFIIVASAGLWRLGSSQAALRRLVRDSSLLSEASLEAIFGKDVYRLLAKGKVEVLQTDAEVSPCCL